jgi:hypothetical protein
MRAVLDATTVLFVATRALVVANENGLRDGRERASFRRELPSP